MMEDQVWKFVSAFREVGEVEYMMHPSFYELILFRFARA